MFCASVMADWAFSVNLFRSIEDLGNGSAASCPDVARRWSAAHKLVQRRGRRLTVLWRLFSRINQEPRTGVRANLPGAREREAESRREKCADCRRRLRGLGRHSAFQEMEHALEDVPPIGTAQDGFAGPFGMRHQAGHV